MGASRDATTVPTTGPGVAKRRARLVVWSLAFFAGLLAAGAVAVAVVRLSETSPRPAIQHIALAAGGDHACAVTAVGGVVCWGNNSEGQLGDGGLAAYPPYSSGEAVEVQGLRDGVAAVAGGSQHTCAVTSAGGAKCWGSNINGELGNGRFGENRSAPVDVDGLAKGVALIDAGQFHTCALTTSGNVTCWGSNEFGQLGNGEEGSEALSGYPTDVREVGNNVVSVSAGGRHSCVLTAAGRGKCWGWNAMGQLGDGTATDRSIAVDVLRKDGEPLEDVTALSAGWGHTCALTDQGSVWCWGGNSSGQIGDGTKGNVRTSPVLVTGLEEGVLAIAAGGFHTCALTAAGGVKCWGSNEWGQLGIEIVIPLPDGTRPVDVSGLTSGVTAISAGDELTCARTTQGAVWCWGSGGFTPWEVSIDSGG